MDDWRDLSSPSKSVATGVAPDEAPGIGVGIAEVLGLWST